MLKRAAVSLLKERAPHLWHIAKYQQYRFTSVGEPEIRAIHRLASKDRTALDIGVHLGFYSRHLAAHCSSVIGFEPNPASAALARKSLPRNVYIEEVAVSDMAGKATLRIPKTGGGGADALGTLENANMLGGVEFQEVSVKTVRLDDYDLPSVCIVKIDVEGHEEAVLRGGRQLLRRDRPACMIEIEERHNPGAFSRVANFFAALDYTAFYLNDGEFEPVDGRVDIGKLQSSSAQRYVNNFFFLPSPMKGAGKRQSI
jgi:FkbM family methyltransferase